MFQRLLHPFTARPGLDMDRDLCTVLDIGTEVVKALVTKRTGKEMIVLGSGTCRQTVKDMAHGTVLDIEGVAENCLEALKEAEHEAGIAPSQVIIGLAGELVRSLASRIEVVRRDPDKAISTEEMQSIAEKVQWKAFDEIREHIEETGPEEVDVKLIHSTITRVSIDGFEVNNPISFTGRQLDITVFNVFAPLVQYRSIETIAELLHRKLLLVACEPYAVSRCLGFDDGSDISALFIDIGGGTTDIAWVQNGGIRSTAMFGIGGRTWTKHISRALDIPHTGAEVLKKSLSADGGSEGKGRTTKKEKLLHQLSTSETKRLKKVIAEATGTWIEGLAISLAQMGALSPNQQAQSSTQPPPSSSRERDNTELGHHINQQSDIASGTTDSPIDNLSADLSSGASAKEDYQSSIFNYISPLPAKIFLCGGGSLLHDLGKTLTKPEWRRQLPFASAPRVTHLYPRDVTNVLDYSEKLVSPQDVTPMALANLALDITVRETTLSKMLRKASRLVER